MITNTAAKGALLVNFREGLFLLCEIQNHDA
jgi:hypothetical protein